MAQAGSLLQFRCNRQRIHGRDVFEASRHCFLKQTTVAARCTIESKVVVFRARRIIDKRVLAYYRRICGLRHQQNKAGLIERTILTCREQCISFPRGEFIVLVIAHVRARVGQALYDLVRKLAPEVLVLGDNPGNAFAEDVENFILIH